LGTRGIPNRYGGFEQAATYIAAGLVNKGHEVTVYNSHDHPHKSDTWSGVNIVHCYDPGYLGSAGQFLYDLNCIRDAKKRKFDVWLFFGYTSSSVWWRLFPAKAVLISNMDGLEWKRSKYNAIVRKFLLYAESLAVRHSHFLIADSTAIQFYLFEKYKVQSSYIAYGAEVFNEEDVSVFSAFSEYGVQKDDYYLVLARMEPENNIEVILDGFCSSTTKKKMIVIGNIDTKFGKYLVNKFTSDKRVLFNASLYDAKKLHTLKSNCSLYFHGHSCGGTNPSLLEAMADGATICSNDNPFNRAILGEDAYYFSSTNDITSRINSPRNVLAEQKMILRNREKIEQTYNWPAIVSAYEKLVNGCYNSLMK
jgi:glycosyltransferase involved in cell wall biosynthesis